MKTFYAITDGDYSDYHIIAITDDKERAENIKKLYTTNWSEPMIEEFLTVNQKTKRSIVYGMTQMEVIM